MPKGGMIRIHSRRVNPQSGGLPRSEISFADTGCGIPAENLGKIFDPFYTTSDRVEGTGLGLSLTRKIVKEHGGTLEVTSKVGKGTVFLLALPAYPDILTGGSGTPD
jgi:signal transduction histidine kinase